MHISMANISEMVTDEAVITSAIKYENAKSFFCAYLDMTLAHFTGQLGTWNVLSVLVLVFACWNGVLP